MARNLFLRRRIGASARPMLVLLLGGAMLSYALIGPTGLFAWGDYAQEVQRLRAELVTADAEATKLANHVALLDGRRADPDLADELVRRELGVAHPDEVIIPITPAPR